MPGLISIEDLRDWRTVPRVCNWSSLRSLFLFTSFSSFPLRTERLLTLLFLPTLNSSGAKRSVFLMSPRTRLFESPCTSSLLSSYYCLFPPQSFSFFHSGPFKSHVPRLCTGAGLCLESLCVDLFFPPPFLFQAFEIFLKTPLGISASLRSSLFSTP